MRAWRRTVTRRGLPWLSDALIPVPSSSPDCEHTAVNAVVADDVVLLSTGSSLAEQLQAIGSSFVKDILVRRAACAMAQLHQAGGYLGHARAEDIDVMGNEIGFSERECEACDDLDVAAAQTRDWLLFVSSVAPHYEKRVGDLAAILFRPMRQLAKPSADALRRTIDALGPLEHAWYRLLGTRLRAMRTALLALHRGLAWQAVPAPSHAIAQASASHHALLRYLDVK